MKHTTKTALAATTAALTAFICQPTAEAQNADALLDKLVEKGVLSVKEANELKQESDSGFTRAFAAKTGLPDWVTSLNFNGDFRARLEANNAENSLWTDRNRGRYRVRFGVTATMVEDFEVGLRLASANPAPSGVGGSTDSANTDLGNGWSRKPIWVDTAYGKWTPIHNDQWTVSGTLGKMDSPFQISNMVFDYDLEPEGAALQMSYVPMAGQTLKFNGGLFLLAELNQTAGAGNSRDPGLYGAQIIWESKWLPAVETALGLSWFSLFNQSQLFQAAAPTAPNVNLGNTRLASGALAFNMQPVVVSSSLTYKFEKAPAYSGEFPVKFAGEFMKNPGAPRYNEGWNAGITFGKANHKGNWELAYRYQHLGADAWYEELIDEDNGAYWSATNPQVAAPAVTGFAATSGWQAGTNIKGHYVKGTYAINDFTFLSVAYYLNNLIVDSPGGSVNGASHLIVDLMWKF